jgi:hypothetical protein
MEKVSTEKERAEIIIDPNILVGQSSEVPEIFAPIIRLYSEKLAQCTSELQRNNMQEAVKLIIQGIQSQISELSILKDENIVERSDDIGDALSSVIEQESTNLNIQEDTKHLDNLPNTYNRYSYLEIATIAKSLINRFGYDFQNQFEIVSNLQQFSLFVTNRLQSVFADPLFIIYNDTRYDDHWLMICITKQEDESFLALYKDSKYQKVIEEIQSILLNKGVSFIAHKATEQDDANSCGPMSLRNMEIMISGLKGDRQNFIQDFTNGEKKLFAQQGEVQEIRRDFSKLIEAEISSAKLETINQLNINGGEKMKNNNTENNPTKASLESATTPTKVAANSNANVSAVSSKTPEQLQKEALQTFVSKEDQEAIEAAIKASLESATTPTKVAANSNANVSAVSSKTPEQLQKEALQSFISKEDQEAIEAAIKASLESVATPTKVAANSNANVSAISSKTPEQLQKERLDVLTETPHEREILERIIQMSKLDSQATLPQPNSSVAFDNIMPPPPPAPSVNTALQANVTVTSGNLSSPLNTSGGITVEDIISLKDKIKDFINELNFSKEKKEEVWDIFQITKDARAGISSEHVRKLFDMQWIECYASAEFDDVSVLGGL